MIRLERITPSRLQQNEIAERMNRTLTERAERMNRTLTERAGTCGFAEVLLGRCSAYSSILDQLWVVISVEL